MSRSKKYVHPVARSLVFARRSARKQKMYAFSGCLILVVGIAWGLIKHNENLVAVTESEKYTNRPTAEATGDNPSELEPGPTGISSYRVAPDMPRVMTIPKIGVESRVKSLGVKPNNELQAPANIYDTGWYKGSSKPGESGAALLDGHVHGPNKPGVFHKLHTLKAGDPIYIERGDGTRITYTVVSQKTYAQQDTDMVAALESIVPGKEGLNIITCTGAVDRATNRYDDRLVIFAVRAE